MTALIIASSEPRAGRSTIAAAIAYRLGRDGRAVTLARLAGDDSSSPDAAAFSALEGVIAAPQPVENAALSTISGDIIIETPPGPVDALAQQLGAQVIVVTGPSSPTLVVASARLAGIIVTGVPASELATVSQRLGALAVIPEDRTLAAPSVADIAAALKAKWLAEGEPASASIGRVMIGTVSSDAAAPYFGNRANTCVVTRYDKTDIQLAALNTGLQCLVLTGGGEPSPYLLDRVAGHRPDVAVLLADGNTVDTVHAIEPLFGKSRFSGQGKLDRIVALLDEANVNIAL